MALVSLPSRVWSWVSVCTAHAHQGAVHGRPRPPRQASTGRSDESGCLGMAVAAGVAVAVAMLAGRDVAGVGVATIWLLVGIPPGGCGQQVQADGLPPQPRSAQPNGDDGE